MSKTNKIKELVMLYDTLLNHLENLSSLTGTVEETIRNLDKIKELNEFHKETRETAKILLSEDLSKISKSPMYLYMAKDINPTSIVFINFITDINKKIIRYIEEDDMENLNKYIKIAKDFSIESNKKFKPFKKQLLKIVKINNI